MHNSLTIALLAGLGGMIGWGAADFFAKKTIDRIGAIRSLVWGHSFGTLLFLTIAAADLLSGGDLDLPTGAGAWLGLLFFGCLQMLVYWLVYEGFGKGQLAVLNPVFASYSGLVALISILFLGESLRWLTGIALVVLFAGIIALNLDPEGTRLKRFRIVPGLKEVGLATLLAAGWTLGWDRFIGGHDSLSYALFMYAFMSLAAFGLSKVMRVGLGGVDRGLWKFLVLIGAGETLAYLAISWGFSATTLTGVVALVSGAFSVPTIILAYVFLKERVSRLQALAIAVVIAGVVLVALD